MSVEPEYIICETHAYQIVHRELRSGSDIVLEREKESRTSRLLSSLRCDG